MKDLTKGNIYKSFILFSIPLALSAVFSQVFRLLDNIIAGRFLGDIGLGAVGATGAFIAVTSSPFWGYSAGFGVYLSNKFGAKEYYELKFALYHSTLFLFLITTFIGISTIIFSNSILNLLKVDDKIILGAKTYLCIYMSGFSIIILNMYLVHALNSLGSSTYPFFVSSFAAALNVLGNILSVTVFKWGVAGIAISTVFSAFVADVFYIVKLLKGLDELGVKSKRIKWDFKYFFKKIVKYTVPTSVQQLFMSGATFLISPVINAAGSGASASWAVILSIYEISACIYTDASRTVSSYTAQSIGAKKYDNIRKGVKVGLIQGLLYLFVPLSVSVIFAKDICALFFPKGYSGIALTYSVIFVRFFLPINVFNVVNNLFHSFYRGCACMRLLVVLTFTGAFSRVIFTYIFAYFYGFYGVFAGWAMSWICEAILAFIIYFKGVWEKEIQKI